MLKRSKIVGVIVRIIMALITAAVVVLVLGRTLQQPQPDFDHPHFSAVPLPGRPPVDIESLMDIRTDADADAKRQRLIELIWGEPELPDGLPDDVERDIADAAHGDEREDRYDDVTNLARIDRLIIRAENGLPSYPYHFHPQEANGHLVIYHQGHTGDFSIGHDTIAALIAEGYAVLAYNMPLLFGNRPDSPIDTPRAGQLMLYDHQHFMFLETGHGTTHRYFIEPVIVGLNYAQTLDYLTYSMVGISGGGWTAVLAAAVDRRIVNSYPVAASVPMYQRRDIMPGIERERDIGDYEQWLLGLYPEFDYLDMYILGAAGRDRHQIAIYNQFDPCCFWGLRALEWADAVSARVDALTESGQFAVWIDDTHREHIISEAAMDDILAHLADSILAGGH